MNLNPFKKKKAEENSQMEAGPPLPPPPAGSESGPPRDARKIIPTDEVRALSSRGVPEPDIIRTLRREGYSTNEIDQAMKDALRSKVSGDFYETRGTTEFGEAPLGGPPAAAPAPDQLPPDLGYPTSGADEEARPPPEYIPPAGPQMPAEPRGSDFMRPAISERPAQGKRSQKGGIDRGEIEELAEVIVEEKLRELRERMKAMDARFSQINAKMDSISGDMMKIRTEKSGEVQGIEQKIEKYSSHIDELNGKIDSMEKALKDSLSPMLESMRSLSELVKSMKETKG